METHIYHLNRDEITDLDVFLKKKTHTHTQPSTKLMQLVTGTKIFTKDNLIISIL